MRTISVSLAFSLLVCRTYAPESIQDSVRIQLPFMDFNFSIDLALAFRGYEHAAFPFFNSVPASLVGDRYLHRLYLSNEASSIHVIPSSHDRFPFASVVDFPRHSNVVFANGQRHSTMQGIRITLTTSTWPERKVFEFVKIVQNSECPLMLSNLKFNELFKLQWVLDAYPAPYHAVVENSHLPPGPTYFPPAVRQPPGIWPAVVIDVLQEYSPPDPVGRIRDARLPITACYPFPMAPLTWVGISECTTIHYLEVLPDGVFDVLATPVFAPISSPIPRYSVRILIARVLILDHQVIIEHAIHPRNTRFTQLEWIGHLTAFASTNCDRIPVIIQQEDQQTGVVSLDSTEFKRFLMRLTIHIAQSSIMPISHLL